MVERGMKGKNGFVGFGVVYETLKKKRNGEERE